MDAMGISELLAGSPQATTRIRRYRDDEVGAHGEELIGLLDHPSAELRGEAARALGRGSCAEAVPALIAHLDDAGQHVATWCAEALGKIGDREAVRPLAALLDRERWVERAYAVQALGRINHRIAVPVLIRALEDKRHAVFTDACDALERLIQPQDRPALEEIAGRLSVRRRRRLRRVVARLDD